MAIRLCSSKSSTVPSSSLRLRGSTNTFAPPGSLEDLIGGPRCAVERERVGKARAAAGLDGDAEAARPPVLLRQLARDDPRRALGDLDHDCSVPPSRRHRAPPAARRPPRRRPRALAPPAGPDARTTRSGGEPPRLRSRLAPSSHSVTQAGRGNGGAAPEHLEAGLDNAPLPHADLDARHRARVERSRLARSRRRPIPGSVAHPLRVAHPLEHRRGVTRASVLPSSLPPRPAPWRASRAGSVTTSADVRHRTVDIGGGGDAAEAEPERRQRRIAREPERSQHVRRLGAEAGRAGRHGNLGEAEQQRFAVHPGDLHVQVARQAAASIAPFSVTSPTSREQTLPQAIAAAARAAPLSPASSVAATAHAAPNPTMPGTFSVPPRRPRSWPPPVTARAHPLVDPRATNSAPTPFGPYTLWALNDARSTPSACNVQRQLAECLDRVGVHERRRARARAGRSRPAAGSHRSRCAPASRSRARWPA